MSKGFADVRTAGLSLLLGLTMVLGACERQHAPAGPAAPARSAAAAASKPAPSAKDKLAEAEMSTINHLNEDGSETVEETPGDTGARNQLLAAVASTVAAATSPASAATPPGSSWQEGVNYTRLVPAQPTGAPAGQIEVLEFFWYACPHCFALQPTVDAWFKSRAPYISFAPVPVLWNDGHRSLARLYYTLQALGKMPQLHAEVFKEIQINGDPLIGADPTNTAQAERLQVAFAKRMGIPEADFEKQYHDFNVEKNMQRADELAQRYRVAAVPTFVINGKYVTDVQMAGGPERLMALINDLCAQEHKH
jgi:protein dithiol oxidoreductase (disulfide-forming)